MMKKLSRLSALLLAICMVISMVPAFALAEDAPTAAPVAAAAPVAEAVAAEAPEAAAAPAVAPTQVSALGLASAALQADEIAATFASDAEALAADYKVKVAGNVTRYFRTFDQYAVVAATGVGAKAGTVITLLDDITITDTNTGESDDNTGVYAKTDLAAAVSAFGVTACTGNSASSYTVFGNSTSECNLSQETVIDLGDHTLTYSGNRVFLSVQRYGLTVQNGKIVFNNTHSRALAAVGSTANNSSDTNRTGAYVPVVTFDNVEAYVNGAAVATSYIWDTTFRVKNSTLITTTGTAAFMMGMSAHGTAATESSIGVHHVATKNPTGTLTLTNSTVGSLASANSGLVYSGKPKYCYGEKRSYAGGSYTNKDKTITVAAHNITGQLAVSVDSASRIVYGTADTLIASYYSQFLIEPTGTPTDKTAVELTVAGQKITAPFLRSYEAKDAASYTPKGGTATGYATLTDAILAAMADTDGNSSTPDGVVTLLADVNLAGEAGFSYKDGAYAAQSGNGLFGGMQNSVEIDFNGHTISNPTDMNFFFPSTTTVNDFTFKAYNGGYSGTGARAFIALSGTTTDTTALYYTVDLKDMTVYCAKTAAIGSNAIHARITLDHCSIFSAAGGNAVNIGAGGSDAVCAANTATYDPVVTIKNGTRLGAGNNYGLGFATKWSNSSYSVALKDPTPKLIFVGENDIYGNSTNPYGVGSWTGYKDAEGFLTLDEGFNAYELTPTEGFGLAADLTVLKSAPCKGRLLISDEAPGAAAYVIKDGVETPYTTFTDAFVAAENASPATVKLNEDVVMTKAASVAANLKVGGNTSHFLILKAGVDLTLDLNGHTMTSDTKDSTAKDFTAFMISNISNTNLTVMNGTVETAGTRGVITVGTSSCAVNDSNCFVTFDNCVLKTNNSSTNICVNYQDGVSYTFNNCTFDAGKNAFNFMQSSACDSACAATVSGENTVFVDHGKDVFQQVPLATSLTITDEARPAFEGLNILRGMTFPEEHYTAYTFGGIFDGTASVTLQENIRVNFFMTPTYAAMDAADFIVDGGAAENDGEETRIKSTGSTACTADKAITVTATCVDINNACTIDAVTATPAAQMAEHAKDPNVGLATLGAATINYAGMAQKYFSGEQSILTTYLTDELSALVEGIVPETPGEKNDQTGGLYFGTSCTLTDDLVMNFYFHGDLTAETFTCDGGKTITRKILVKNEIGNADYTKVSINPTSGEIYNSFTITVQGKTITDSVAAYCQRMIGGNTALNDLCNGVLKYGTAASAYFNK